MQLRPVERKHDRAPVRSEALGRNNGRGLAALLLLLLQGLATVLAVLESTDPQEQPAAWRKPVVQLTGPAIDGDQLAS